MYLDPTHIGIHLSPKDLWGFHREAEQAGQALPVALVLGHHPAFQLGSAAVATSSLDEYRIAGALLGTGVRVAPSLTFGDELPVPAESEVIIEGRLLPGVRCVEGPFGEMLDSLCDVIGFVVAPAFLAYQADLRSYDLVGPAVMFAFIACGAIRLARFPLIKAKAYFLGLPTPASGATLGMLSLYAGELPEGLLVVATGGLAILMVTLIRFPKFNTTLRFLPPPMRWVFVLVVVPSLIVFQPKALLGLMCLYLLSGPAIELRLQRGGPGA